MGNELIKRNNLLQPIPGCTPKSTCLIFHKDLSEKEWQEVGSRLRKIEGAVQWWIID